MRYLLILILTIFIGVCYGQNFSYPSLNTKGKSITDFVPNGWTIFDSAHGDLNKDGLEDLALILQYKDSVTLVNNEEDTVLTQPRILVILFKSHIDTSFELKEYSNSFVLKHDNSAMDDPYQGTTIDKGILKIEFHLF